MSEQTVVQVGSPDPNRIFLAFQNGPSIPKMPAEDQQLARRWFNLGMEKAGVVKLPDGTFSLRQP